MKGYLNTILSQLTSTASAEVRDVAVKYRRSFRKSLAAKILSRRSSHVLRFQPSFTIDGVDVYMQPDSLYVWSFGVVGAVGTLILNPEDIKPYPNKIDVYYDDAFTLLSDECRSAIIAHEVGHYKLGHNQKALDGYRPDAKESFEWELAADTWALEQGFNIIKALVHIMHHYRKSLTAQEFSSLRQRVMHLKQHQLAKDWAIDDPNVPLLFKMPSGNAIKLRHPTLDQYRDDVKITQMKS